METTFFAIKRLHLRTLAIGRRLLVPSLLTPARFDLARLVALRAEGIIQRSIVTILGVSGATVSRMLKALERMGVVVRSPWELDRRCLLVQITPIGIDLLGRAYAETVMPRISEHMAAAMITDQQHPDIDDPEVVRAVGAFEDRLVHARLRLRDPSPVRHPWLAVDVVDMHRMMFDRYTTPPPDHVASYSGIEEQCITSEGRGLAWDPPAGYVPPAPDSYGLMPSPEDLGRTAPRPTDHRAHRERAAAVAEYCAMRSL